MKNAGKIKLIVKSPIITGLPSNNRDDQVTVLPEVIKETLASFKMKIDELAKKNEELEMKLRKQESQVVTNNNNTLNQTNNTLNQVNNTVIYNCFDGYTIDIFTLMKEKYGSEKAISFASQLLKGKTKSTKHNWMLDSDLGIDMKSLSHVVSYDSTEKDPCFRITGADQKVTKDRDGSLVDKILSDMGANAGLQAHSCMIRKASETYENGERDADGNGNGDGMWTVLSNGSIYDNRKKETIFDDLTKFRKIPPSKPHLLKIIPIKTS